MSRRRFSPAYAEKTTVWMREDLLVVKRKRLSAIDNHNHKLLAQMTVALYACRDSYCDLPCSHNTPFTEDDRRRRTTTV